MTIDLKPLVEGQLSSLLVGIALSRASGNRSDPFEGLNEPKEKGKEEEENNDLEEE